MSTCDLRDIITLRDKQGKQVYGKKMLESHKLYDLWNEETDTFDLSKIELFYSLFIYNMNELKNIFRPKWVKPHELLTTSQKLIWDWSSEEEKKRTADDINKFGTYFPILTLDKGYLHNQIISDKEKEELKKKGLYNSYNGNHRIDAIHFLLEQKIWDKNKDILIYIIPPFCQKSCTGFKYDPIDDHDLNHPLVQWKLDNLITLYHLDYVEHETKVTNWRKLENLTQGISMVKIDNYNVAFRVMLELCNVLEPVLVRYYELNNTLPEFIIKKSKAFNNKLSWNKTFNPDKTFTPKMNKAEKEYILKDIQIDFKKINTIANECDLFEHKTCKERNKYRNCDRPLCCSFCPAVNCCENVCDIILNKSK